MPGFIADKRLFLNRDKSAVVDGDDPEAAFLLAAEGAFVSEEDADRYGLKAPKAKADEAATAGEAEPVKSQAHDKAVRGPRA